MWWKSNDRTFNLPHSTSNMKRHLRRKSAGDEWLRMNCLSRSCGGTGWLFRILFQEGRLLDVPVREPGPVSQVRELPGVECPARQSGRDLSTCHTPQRILFGRIWHLLYSLCHWLVAAFPAFLLFLP